MASPCASAPHPFTACRRTPPWATRGRATSLLPTAACSSTRRCDTSVFRIDHDQAFQQTTHLIYRRPNNGPWVAFTWRYDSGLVAGAVGSLDDALGLTRRATSRPSASICGSQFAIAGRSPIADCASPNFGATRLVIPAAGTDERDHNPPRIAPRHLFDLGRRHGQPVPYRSRPDHVEDRPSPT